MMANRPPHKKSNRRVFAELGHGSLLLSVMRLIQFSSMHGNDLLLVNHCLGTSWVLHLNSFRLAWLASRLRRAICSTGQWHCGV
jgi:hypothetical protein